MMMTRMPFSGTSVQTRTSPHFRHAVYTRPNVRRPAAVLEAATAAPAVDAVQSDADDVKPQQRSTPSPRMAALASIEAGNTYDSKIVSLTATELVLNVGGITVRMPAKRVSNSAIEDLTKVFEEGEAVKVLVTLKDMRRRKFNVSIAALEATPGAIITDKQGVWASAEAQAAAFREEREQRKAADAAKTLQLAQSAILSPVALLAMIDPNHTPLSADSNSPIQDGAIGNLEEIKQQAEFILARRAAGVDNLKIGYAYDAEVLSLSANEVTLDVEGVEVKMPIRNVSQTRVEHMKNVFIVHEMIKVLVTARTPKSGVLVSCKELEIGDASIVKDKAAVFATADKAAEQYRTVSAEKQAKRQAYIDTLKVGDTVQAQVTYTQGSKYYLQVEGHRFTTGFRRLQPLKPIKKNHTYQLTVLEKLDTGYPIFGVATTAAEAASPAAATPAAAASTAAALAAAAPPAVTAPPAASVA